MKFEFYLIMVGIRSLEFTHSDETLSNNIEYFRKCYKDNLSAYKALLMLSDEPNEKVPSYGVIESTIIKE